MKFLHMADMHFDAPFTSLSNAAELGQIRKLEQREAFKKIIQYIIDNQIEYLFIAGDLYEHYGIKESTVEFINNEFKKIENTQVFIVPGNHDPYIKNSYYETFEFMKNVHILKDNFGIYEDEKIRIYGVGFTDFFMNENPLLDEKIIFDSKICVLISHCDVNGVKDKNGFSYNPILLSKLKEYKFDYIALGHIHNINFKENEILNYCGSTISFGFDEIGKHGVIVGELEKNKLKTEFLEIDDRIFTEYELNVEKFLSDEEIIEHINGVQFKEKEMIKIILKGYKNFDIDTKKILNLIYNKNVLKIKDESKLNIDIEKLSKEESLRGIFIQEVIEKYNKGEITKQDMEKIIEIGIDAM